MTGEHRGFQGFGRHVGFVWEGLVSRSWVPPYLCLSDAQSLSQKAYLARWQRVKLSSIWFQLFRKPFLQPESYVTFVPRWLRRLMEAVQVSRLMRTDSFILTIWFSPNILMPHTWADTTVAGGCDPGPLFISQRAGRRAVKNAGTQLAFYLFIFVPYSTWATSHRQPNTFSLGLLSVFNSLWKYAQKTPEIAVLMMLIKLQAPLEWSTMGNWAELGSRNSVTQWESEPTMVIASKEPGWVFLDDENGSFHSSKLKAKLEGSWRTSLHSWAVDEWIRTRIHILDFFSSLSMWE